MACQTCAEKRAAVTRAIAERKPAEAVRHTAEGAKDIAANFAKYLKRRKG